jgi:transcription elongation factor GreA
MAKLKDELYRLQTVDRPEVIKAIEEARAHGDLSENAEFHAAKDRQNEIMNRINTLQNMIGESRVVEIKGPYTKCVFGATFTMVNLETDEERTYTLVGPHESDPQNGFLSLAAPIGRAVTGLVEGDDFFLTTPGGEEEYRIVSVS